MQQHDVNPPVHGWATWKVYQMEKAQRGQGDRAFLERVFHKLLLNFNWWVNRKDASGRNIFQGGSEEIALTEYLASPGRPHPADSRSNDRWFQHIAIVVSDIDIAYRRLRAFDVKHASTGPQTLPDWNPNAAGIRAFYFRDPDGHALEIIWFPPGKGNPRWPLQKGLFLGIDHTAIVVADTDKSLAFYRDALGLLVAGGSENYGPSRSD